MLSKRMKRRIDKSGHVGSRIAWVRIKGPVCPIFFIAVYIPHKYRTEAPMAADTLAQLDALLKTIPKNDCVVVCGDFNCQLRRNIPGCTGRWAMTKQNEKIGHDQEVLDMMRAHELFAVDTKLSPRQEGGHHHLANAFATQHICLSTLIDGPLSWTIFLSQADGRAWLQTRALSGV